MGDKDSFTARAVDLGISDRVLFAGSVSNEEKWSYLRSCDFYCLPSDAEGQPISILEAMAIGLPIIATSVGSIPEIISEGTTGFIIPVGNEDALEESILKVMDDNLRFEMGRAAKEYLLRHHDIKILFEKLGSIYLKTELSDYRE
jgi:glycosyltransferase involved in cell wall biosynthesis